MITELTKNQVMILGGLVEEDWVRSVPPLPGWYDSNTIRVFAYGPSKFLDFEHSTAAKDEFSMVLKQLEDKGLIEIRHDAWHGLLISITDTGRPLGLQFNKEAVVNHRRHYESKL